MKLLILISCAVVAAADAQRRVRVRGRPRRVQPIQQPRTSECPLPEGLQLYPDPNTCHGFYKCANGTLTYERCENGLLFDPEKGLLGGVHNHCSYNWAVNCGEREVDDTPISNGVCEYQFGIYPNPENPELCYADYVKCEFGAPVSAKCDLGLVYDHRIHGCNWPDQLSDVLDCDPSTLLGFECPRPDQLTPLESRFAPFPRFAVTGLDKHYILCVNNQPRLSACGGARSVFDPTTLSCIEQF